MHRLADLANAANATLVHFSSDFVFGGESNRLYVEEDTPNPLSVYARSKADANARRPALALI